MSINLSAAKAGEEWDEVAQQPGVYIKREKQDARKAGLSIEDTKKSLLDSLSDVLTEKQKTLIQNL